jgi:hypothetical protein
MRSLADLTPATERRWFEFDRGAVMRQIDVLQKTIGRNADDMGMVALEGVFDKPLSDKLLRSSRSLLKMRRELNALRAKVMQASGYRGLGKKLS